MSNEKKNRFAKRQPYREFYVIEDVWEGGVYERVKKISVDKELLAKYLPSLFSESETDNKPRLIPKKIK